MSRNSRILSRSVPIRTATACMTRGIASRLTRLSRGGSMRMSGALHVAQGNLRWVAHSGTPVGLCLRVSAGNSSSGTVTCDSRSKNRGSNSRTCRDRVVLIKRTPQCRHRDPGNGCADPGARNSGDCGGGDKDSSQFIAGSASKHPKDHHIRFAFQRTV